MSRIHQILEDPRRFRHHVIIVLCIAVLVRVVVVAAFWHSWGWHNGDIPDSWNKLAINLSIRDFRICSRPINLWPRSNFSPGRGSTLPCVW